MSIPLFAQQFSGLPLAAAQELEDAAHCIKLLGGRVEEPFDYAIPGAGVTHRVIPIRKAAPTLKGYPRRWAKIQKAPL